MVQSLTNDIPGGAGRFNERLVLSLASNTNCMLMDDELNILPISSHVRDGLKPVPLREDGTPDVPGNGEPAAELKELVESLRDVQVSVSWDRSRSERLSLKVLMSESARHQQQQCHKSANSARTTPRLLVCPSCLSGSMGSFVSTESDVLKRARWCFMRYCHTKASGVVQHPCWGGSVSSTSIAVPCIS